MKLIIGVIGRRSFINSLLLAVFAVLGAASSSRTNAQGVWLDNIWNTSADPAAGSNGQFWIQTNGTSLVLINQDFNAAFYAGATPTNLSLLATFLLSDGTATGDNWAGPGKFSDPMGGDRTISGASGGAYFQIQAWTGSYTNYSSALSAGAYVAQSPVFSNAVAAPPSVPPALSGMPAIVLAGTVLLVPVETNTTSDAGTVSVVDEFSTNFAPWVVQDLPMPDSSPTTSDALQNQSSNSLMQLSLVLSTNAALNDTAINAFLETNAWGIQGSGTDGDGGSWIIDGFDPLGAPVIKSTFNLESAQTVSAQKVWPGGGSGLNLTGTNVLIGQWDGGDAQTNHQEFWLNGFNVKLLNGPSGAGIDWHSTHVAGTLAAYGGVAMAEGFANRGKVIESWFKYDTAQMPGVVATNALRVSNHSYGNLGGWLQTVIAGSNTWLWAGNDSISVTQDWHFGFYDAYAQTNDAIIYSAQTYLPVFAAGNERGPGLYRPPTQPFNHWDYTTVGGVLYYLYTSGIRPLNDAQGGFNNLTSFAVAKNDLVVGAVAVNTNGYTGTNSVAMSSFSSWGPVADGRIKPDVCAAGVQILSTYGTNQTVTNLYALADGTSMATPAVAGTVALLSQLSTQLNGPTNPPLASTLKGVVVHTADLAGTNTGPSYIYGWGQMNALSAAKLVTNNASSSLAFIKECRLVSGDFISFPVQLTNGAPFKATIAWTDPPGTPVAPSVNPTNHMLVNDLDLRVISASGATNFPYRLDPSSPASPATTGDNTVDNVEQVYIASPASGTYTVQVTHKGTLVNDKGQTSYQNVSIMLSGNVPQPPIQPRIVQFTSLPGSNTVALKWTCDVGRVCRIQYANPLSTGANNWQFATGELSATKTNTAFVLSTLGTTNRFYRIVQVR